MQRSINKNQLHVSVTEDEINKFENITKRCYSYYKVLKNKSKKCITTMKKIKFYWITFKRPKTEREIMFLDSTTITRMKFSYSCLLIQCNSYEKHSRVTHATWQTYFKTYKKEQTADSIQGTANIEDEGLC